MLTSGNDGSATAGDTASSQFDWYNIERPNTTWLVDGLITSDGNVAVCGKPKAGKSSLVRHMVACIIKGEEFLGRSVDVPAGTGRVLYIHLDRKDRPWRVAEEFKRLGITQEAAERLVIRTEEHIKGAGEDKREARLDWLKKEVASVQPHLIVIDLLWQFLNVRDANAYKEVLDGINQLQDALREIGYKGATLVTIHSRKAANPNNPADDILGSTVQSGSFNTTIMLTRNRKDDTYTIMSDQTDRDDAFGEIDECQITRNPDGSFALGSTVADMRVQENKSKREVDLNRLLVFIGAHGGCAMDDILKGLSMSEKYARKLMEQGCELIQVKGTGKKGDPFRYFAEGLDDVTKLQAFVARAKS